MREGGQTCSDGAKSAVVQKCRDGQKRSRCGSGGGEGGGGGGSRSCGGGGVAFRGASCSGAEEGRPAVSQRLLVIAEGLQGVPSLGPPWRDCPAVPKVPPGTPEDGLSLSRSPGSSDDAVGQTPMKLRRADRARDPGAARNRSLLSEVRCTSAASSTTLDSERPQRSWILMRGLSRKR